MGDGQQVTAFFEGAPQMLADLKAQLSASDYDPAKHVKEAKDVLPSPTRARLESK